MTLVAVLLAGAVGAVARHLLVIGFASHRRRLPLGLIIANVAGCLLLGLLVGARLAGDLSTLTLTILGTGLCGALTTWSSFILDVVERIEAGDRREAAVIVGVSLGLGGAAAALGLALTGGLSG